MPGFKLVGNVDSMKAHKKETPKHKHLARTFLFWVAFLGPLVVGGVLGVFIGNATPVGELCFKSECVQFFFDTFKFPVAIMSLSLPLVAMVAAIHRSMEAATQIDVALKQYGEAIANNRFGNYLKHREGFEKLIDGYCSKRHHNNGCKTYVNVSDFYADMFPDASFGNVDWNGHYNKDRFEDVVEVAEVLMHQLEGPIEDCDAIQFVCSLGALLSSFNINYSLARIVAVNADKGPPLNFVIPALDSDSQSVFHAIRDAIGIFVLLRSYLGIKGGRDFPISDKFSRVRTLLENAGDKFSVLRPA